MSAEKILIDVLVSVILIAIITLALIYIIKSKKSGQKCIGCPYSKQCGKCCNSNKKVTIINKNKFKVKN